MEKSASGFAIKDSVVHKSNSTIRMEVISIDEKNGLVKCRYNTSEGVQVFEYFPDELIKIKPVTSDDMKKIIIGKKRNKEY
ncbi:hypothetical protein SDC9_67198 [bioreactor metagenome]|uniref:Uncharacterized protein n=1 Tax=bioreactor metagenome TaxID=1076179 RepID=A0A644XWY4_9ZZZZ